jgi:hypothetical protein
MATFTWTGQGTNGSNNTTIGATDVVRFSGSAFGTNVVVNAYQDTTHVENSGGTEICASGIHLHNIKYVSSGNFTLDGGGSTALSGSVPTTANCTLKINFSDATSVVTTGGLFYAYDASTTTVAPTGVTFQAFEQSDTTWTNAGGSASAVTINDDTTATSHDYYFGISATPTSVGEKTAFKLRIELTYA